MPPAATSCPPCSMQSVSCNSFCKFVSSMAYAAQAHKYNHRPSNTLQAPFSFLVRNIWRPRGLSAVAVCVPMPAFTGRASGLPLVARARPFTQGTARPGLPLPSRAEVLRPNVNTLFRGVETLHATSLHATSLRMSCKTDADSVWPTPRFLFLVPYYLFLVCFSHARRAFLR
jgi:hypothetical protein